MAAARASHRLGVRFIHGIYAWNYVLFCPFFLNYFTFHFEIRIVVRILWRSEAFRIVPWLRHCTRLRLVLGFRPRPLISTMHGQPFLITLTKFHINNFTLRDNSPRILVWVMKEPFYAILAWYWNHKRPAMWKLVLLPLTSSWKTEDLLMIWGAMNNIANSDISLLFTSLRFLGQSANVSWLIKFV